MFLHMYFTHWCFAHTHTWCRYVVYNCVKVVRLSLGYWQCITRPMALWFACNLKPYKILRFSLSDNTSCRNRLEQFLEFVLLFLQSLQRQGTYGGCQRDPNLFPPNQHWSQSDDLHRWQVDLEGKPGGKRGIRSNNRWFTEWIHPAQTSFLGEGSNCICLWLNSQGSRLIFLDDETWRTPFMKNTVIQISNSYLPLQWNLKR